MLFAKCVHMFLYFSHTKFSQQGVGKSFILKKLVFLFHMIDGRRHSFRRFIPFSFYFPLILFYIFFSSSRHSYVFSLFIPSHCVDRSGSIIQRILRSCTTVYTDCTDIHLYFLYYNLGIHTYIYVYFFHNPTVHPQGLLLVYLYFCAQSPRTYRR